MQYADIIAREADLLPLEKQAEVLDFIEFLKVRQSREMNTSIPSTPEEIEAFFRNFNADTSGYNSTGKKPMPAKSFSNEEVLLQQMVQTIINEVAPETIILFGSRARGDARADSDVDLLVVEAEPFSPQRSRRKEAARLYMALRGLAVSKDILLYSREEFEHWKNSPNHVAGRAHREGRVLHARP